MVDGTICSLEMVDGTICSYYLFPICSYLFVDGTICSLSVPICSSLLNAGVDINFRIQ